MACRTLEDVGTPFVQILMEAQRYDLILLGRQTHFDYGSEGEPDETLGKVLPDSPRPGGRRAEDAPASGEAVVVAYDGSLQAARALYAFEASGLGAAREVHVVSVARDTRTPHAAPTGRSSSCSPTGSRPSPTRWTPPCRRPR